MMTAAPETTAKYWQEYYDGSYKYLQGYSILVCKSDAQRAGFRAAEAETERQMAEDEERHQEFLDEEWHARGMY